MKILHTSDWHLGSQFCGKKRYDEYDAFLSWLDQCIGREEIDLLIIAGDIFDTGTPANRALEQYYQFIGRNAQKGCRIVVTGGNHDSPTLLNAPRDILKTLNIHVIGSIPENPEDAVLGIPGPDGEIDLIVCAVPYLRDRDLRSAQPGESPEEKNNRLIRGIGEYYQKICSAALKRRAVLGREIPILATGHLYAAGSVTGAGDEMHASIGSSIRVGSEIFPACIDYLALGHLHRPQKVFGEESMRYSGSPLPMEFSATKNIILSVEIPHPGLVHVTEIPVPTFRHIEQIRGEFCKVEERMGELIRCGDSVWVEVLLDDPALIPQPVERLREMANESRVEVLRVKDLRLGERIMQQMEPEESLETMTPAEVFQRRLDAADLPPDQRAELTTSFAMIMKEIQEEDSHAE